MSAHAIRQVNSTTPATKAIRFIDSSRSERVFRFVVQLFFVKGNVSLCRRVGPVNYSASPLLWLQPGWGWGAAQFSTSRTDRFPKRQSAEFISRGYEKNSPPQSYKHKQLMKQCRLRASSLPAIV